MNINLDSYYHIFIKLIYILLVVLLSFYLGTLFTLGDQVHYINYYNQISYETFLDSYFLQRDLLGSREPGYFLISYFFSNILGIDKIIFITILNMILGWLIVTYLLDNKVSIFIIFSTLLNFYILVLFFSAERLKLALVFVFIYFLYKRANNSLIKLFSIFSHLQVVIIYIAEFILDFIYKNNKIKLILGIVIIILVSFFLREHLVEKISAYQKEIEIIDLVKIIIFMFLSILYNKNKLLEILFVFFPMIIFSLLLGSERITIIAYFLFIYYVISYNGGLSMAIITTTFYYNVKGIIFIYNIFNFGDGFSTEIN